MVLTGCDGNGAPRASTAAIVPAMRWDHRPEADIWTSATMSALTSHGAALAQTEPADIDTWCPAYREASPTARRAFWSGLLSALAKHESTWRPDAVGGGGRWFGLVQIAPATARGYGCKARSGAALQDGGANLSCAVRIMAHTVPRDGVVAAGGGGVAADWGPFAWSSKRADMAHWTASQSYCRKPI
nr:transglycosylase SLT domain-containing protein [Maritimibacter sp. 55A14]